VLIDESGFMLQPVRRNTWAPSGQTPVQNAWDRRDRLSAIGALTLAPHVLRVGWYFQLLSRNVKADDIVAFLKQLHRHLGRDLIVVMDRWQVHRSAARRLEKTECKWFKVEWLPPYAPELNPVEFAWNHTKYTDLANFIPDDLEHLRTAVLDSFVDQHDDAWLKHSYFRSAHLDV
jgi:transposase